MPAFALNHHLFTPFAPAHPALDQVALTIGLTSLHKCQQACDAAGGETVGSYGLMACVELFTHCQARCKHAELMLLEFAEVELGLLRSQLGECAEICDRCANACKHHRDFEFWAECGDSAQECASICRYLLMRLPTVSSGE